MIAKTVMTQFGGCLSGELRLLRKLLTILISLLIAFSWFQTHSHGSKSSILGLSWAAIPLRVTPELNKQVTQLFSYFCVLFPFSQQTEYFISSFYSSHISLHTHLSFSNIILFIINCAALRSKYLFCLNVYKIDNI